MSRQVQSWILSMARVFKHINWEGLRLICYKYLNFLHKKRRQMPPFPISIIIALSTKQKQVKRYNLDTKFSLKK